MTNGYALRSRILLTNTVFGLSFIHEALPEQRKQNIDFHVQSQDYFGTLATIMSLMADALSSGDAEARERCIKTLSELREDLEYLQKTHTIERRH